MNQIADRALELTLGSPRLSYDYCLKTLAELGYARVSIVVERHEYSVKGSLIDVYPANQTHPLRLEFDFDKLISLRSFDVNNQKSISKLTNTTITAAGSIPHFMSRQSDPTSVGQLIISDMKKDDYVVHANHGIAYFGGLQRLKIKKVEGEYLVLHYAGEDRIYVPLNQIHLIHKYNGPAVPQVTSLKSKNWEKQKQKARQAADDIAEELLALYKHRQHHRGFAFGEENVWEIDLKESFPFQETPDQEKAIAQVVADMGQPTPMDRLICGDVGYGKTEVALRAAFKAAIHGKQTAILVPTTLLARQHHQTFGARLASFGLRVDLLSRFVDKTQQKEVLRRLASGATEVVVGTHRLLQKDIHFKDLGLLIIDEEQRFGVKHKEKLKQYRKTVDVLTMTATPIPRTLYMSLAGARDISVINTPPKNRFPIKTTVTEYSSELIKKAVRAELNRGGQVFYLHNEVKTIDSEAAKLRFLLPEARIAVGHGQLRENQLEKVMVGFLDKHYDILVCTTIIESGLDIPSANTLIVNNADRFGLAQLHQIRGRVGRSDVHAHALLLYRSAGLLTSEADERLRALKEFTALGAGYQIALRDLEIRGAGNLLGREQSGNITAIGFTLFCKLLEDSVKQVRGEIIPESKTFEIDDYSYIPQNYIPDERQRIAIYQRLMSVSKDIFYELTAELADRFGKFPRPLQRLLDSIERQL